jgi:site-specific recombinase XerD
MATTRGTFKFLCFIKKNKLLQSGKAPLYGRITINGGQVEFALHQDINENLWSQQAGRSVGRDSGSRKLNDHLDQVRVKIMNAYTDLIAEGKEPTALLVKNRAFGLDEKPIRILELYEEHNQKLKEKIDISISRNTYIRHCTTRSHLGLFIAKKYGATDKPIKEINNAFVQDFEHYLRVDRQCNNNSSVKYLKNFRKIIKYALDNGWITRDPFLGIRFRLEKTNKPFLTIEELQRLMQKDMDIHRLAVIRDVFVFCSHTGLSFIDIKNLTYADLKVMPSGRTWIEKPRQKTKVIYQVPLMPEAKALVEKYRHYPEKNDPALVFPVLSNQKMNAYLKEIATICDIEKDLTTHVARHTFATTIALNNGITKDVIAKMLGHSTTKETDLYAVVEQQLIESQMRVLLHPIEQN